MPRAASVKFPARLSARLRKKRKISRAAQNANFPARRARAKLKNGKKNAAGVRACRGSLRKIRPYLRALRAASASARPPNAAANAAGSGICANATSMPVAPKTAS